MDKRKELRERYKSRKVVGGVYRIVNTQTGSFLLLSTDDMQSAHNYLRFSKLTGNCTIPALKEAWKQYGRDVFEIEELELLEKKQERTNREFRQELDVLLELWSEKLPLEQRY